MCNFQVSNYLPKNALPCSKFDKVQILFVLSERQFMVEVDASNIWVGAILSQRLPHDDKVRPCVFLLHRLSPVERNYDVGNHELLAIHLSSGEWPQWLNEASLPFIVWTDHRNVEYFRSAKRLNARQTRWA